MEHNKWYVGKENGNTTNVIYPATFAFAALQSKCFLSGSCQHIRVKRCATQIRPKAAQMLLVTSAGVAVELSSMDVKFGDSRLNACRIIRLFTDCTRFTHFYAVFNCILTESS